jgi:copper homeostasis protein
MILEACVETLEEAIKAEQNGAHRLELCSHLDLDGLTPDIKMTECVLQTVSIPVKVMIRPRAGNFIYSNEELEVMKEDILSFKKKNIKGFVFGILDHQNHLNLNQIKTLAGLAHPLDITIHKAIDLCPDPVKEVEKLLRIKKVTSVLISGGKNTAIEGCDTIRKMIKSAGDSLTIISAGCITSSNLQEVHELIKGTEYHGRKIV